MRPGPDDYYVDCITIRQVMECISRAIGVSGHEAVFHVFEKYHARVMGDVVPEDRKAFLDDLELLGRTLH